MTDRVFPGALCDVAEVNDIPPEDVAMAYRDYLVAASEWRDVREGTETNAYRRKMRRQLEAKGDITAKGYASPDWRNMDYPARQAMLRLGWAYEKKTGQLPGYSVRPSGKLGGNFLYLCEDFFEEVGHPKLGTRKFRTLADEVRTVIKSMVAKRTLS
jgi:hypothetical protein